VREVECRTRGGICQPKAARIQDGDGADEAVRYPARTTAPDVTGRSLCEQQVGRNGTLFTRC
jgi:hypothetical protein